MLSERDAVIELATTYAWSLDTHDWAALERVFTSDCVATLGWRLDGRDAVIERIKAALTPLDASHHLNGSHQVSFDDADTAHHRCYFHAQHVRQAAEGGPHYVVAGTYHDVVHRTEDGWRIAERVLTTVWTSGNPHVIRRL